MSLQNLKILLVIYFYLRKLLRYENRHLGKRKRDKALSTLEEAGEIVKVENTPGSKRGLKYRVADLRDENDDETDDE